MEAGKIKRKKGPKFTQVGNHILQDEKLSWKAKGLMSYLLSLPEDWELFKTELVKRSKDGYESMISGWKELENAGYLETKQIKKGNLFMGYEYEINEFPVLDFTDQRNTNQRNPELIYTNSNNTNSNLYIKAESKKDSAEEMISNTVKAKRKKKEGVKILNFSPEESLEIYGDIKQFFLDLYLSEYKTAYYFAPLNGAKVHGIISKVIFKMKEKHNHEDFEPQQIIDATNFFIQVAYVTADNFLQSNFNLSNLDSKFNDIYTKIINGQTGNIKFGGNKPTSRFRTA